MSWSVIIGCLQLRAVTELLPEEQRLWAAPAAWPGACPPPSAAHARQSADSCDWLGDQCMLLAMASWMRGQAEGGEHEPQGASRQGLVPRHQLHIPGKSC